ncbi:APC family permease [Pseudonocardia kujensis]|uniref:APC family permease n=1 Tax=Pseudonocardia kujensis TaxID=1128675 RepID=UPI001E45298B|nr:APC family permease [Pseudonocardia kujensis]MCE0764458.1 APC family permease [Pseudonocardia kujensis]
MDTPALQRRLGTFDATVIGLGSMIGAGVFAAFAPAAAAAGSALLVGLALAAVVAWCNATSSAQLAARYPRSGGTYVYGRERLGPWWGFVAGWGFVVGKTASCAAMALTAAAYLVPGAWQRPAAVLAVVVVTGVNLAGVTRTARSTRVLVALVLLALAAILVTAVARDRLPPAGPLTGAPGVYAVLQAAGLLFFAFAGYARVATLGEEVRDPARTIPRAITLALTGAIVVYAAVGVVLLGVLGPARLAASSAPLADVLPSGATWLAAVGGALASLGALLGLVAGVGRTVLAMAREADLPAPLAAVDARRSVPRRAEIAVAVVVVGLVCAVDLRGAIGFSSFGVLLYYFVANLSALGQPRAERRYPRAFALLGLLGCAVLVVTLPWRSVVAGVGVVVVGVGYRWVRLRIRGGRRA